MKVISAKLQQLPTPIPNEKQDEYERLILQVLKLTSQNLHLLEVTGYPELGRACIRDAKRTLRKIADVGEGADPGLQESILPEHISRAAGHDFAGIGGSREKRSQYWRWVELQGADAIAANIVESVRKLALAAIHVIETGNIESHRFSPRLQES